MAEKAGLGKGGVRKKRGHEGSSMGTDGAMGDMGMDEEKAEGGVRGKGNDGEEKTW